MREVKGVLAAAIMAAAIALAACAAHPSIAYVDTGGAYTTQQLQTLLDSTIVPGSIADARIANAAKLRHEALVQLRSQGPGPSAAADLVTKTFAPTTESVPVYVERAKVGGADSVIIVEAWSDSNGRLSSKRLWVVDAESGQIRYSASVSSRR